MTENGNLAADLAARTAAWAGRRQGYALPVLAGAGLNAARMAAPTALERVVYQPIYCLVLQGQKAVRLGERTIAFTPGEGVIVSHHLPALAQVERATAAEPYLALALELDVDLLRAIAGESGGIAPPDAPAEPIRAGRAAPPLLDAMGRLLALADEPDAAPVLAPLLRREIHFRLLRSEHGGMLRRLAEADSHASRIARAIAMIRARYAEPLAVGALARAAGMSASSFHAHFRAITATTPVQFQKQLRLTEARARLLSGRESVGAAARAVGYESPTQFSRDYARAFGHPPRQDLAAAA